MSSFHVRRVMSCAALGLAAVSVAAPARAGGVQWSIGIEAPLFPGSVSTVISSAPRGYHPPPRSFLPPQPQLQGWPRPIYYVDAPPPVVYYYAPAPRYYRPAPVYVRDWERRGHEHRPHWKQHRHHDRDDD